MNCERCGKVIPEGGGSCPDCGGRAAGNKRSRTGRALAVVLPVLSLLCIGIALLYYAVLGDIGKPDRPDDASASPEQTADAPETIHLSGTVDEASAPEKTPAQPTAGQTDKPDAEPDVKLVLSQTELTLAPGEQAGLSVSVQAPYGREVYVFWSSSDETVASIDPSGMVTDAATGDCDMIASDGEVRSLCHGTVAETAEDSYLLPTDSRVITESDVSGMDRETVCLARNEIFARHGRVFKTASIQAYFEAQSWYAPDPDFDENAPGALSTLEKQNLSFLVAYETQKGWR